MNREQELMEYYLQENLHKIKNKIIVMSGKGGVGKSTVSVNLAHALAMRGNKVGILDVDVHGPSVAKMAGVHGVSIDVSGGGRIKPIENEKNLYIISVASMLRNPDDPVIWRGPAKIGVIRQFLSAVEWPMLDYLVVDCPPGTGDEPLSIVQIIGDVTGVVIVTTPQDVALLDVRKSINFVRKLDTPILGIVENMSGFICPECGERIDIFKSGGADKAAADFNLELLGKIPLEAAIVHSGDEGKPYVYSHAESEGGKIFHQIAERVVVNIEKRKNKLELAKMQPSIAIPLDGEMISQHFGHCDRFAIYKISRGKVESKEISTPPAQGHSAIPSWLDSLGVNTVISGGMGESAANAVKSYDMILVKGVAPVTADEAVMQYLAGTLKDGESSCGHDCGGSCGSCGH